MQVIYDKVLCACRQYSAEFVENYVSFSSLLYARDFKQCYSFIFSLVNAIDESGMPLATELMQYFWTSATYSAIFSGFPDDICSQASAFDAVA